MKTLIKTTKRLIAPLAVIMLLAFTAGAFAQDDVPFVHNAKPKWGDKQKFELQFVRTIGGMDADDENYQFFQARFATKDSDGNYYIVDVGNNRIQKFDPEGKYLLTMGGEGQGPGELLGPTNLVIDNKNTIHIINTRNMRIEKYSLDGELAGSYKMPKIFIQFSIFSDGTLVAPVINAEGIPGLPNDSGKKTTMMVIDSEGKEVTRFGEMKDYGNPTLNISGNMFSLAVDKSDNIYCPFATENLIVKYNKSGKLLLKFDRPFDMKIEHKMGTRSVTINGQKRSFPFPETTSVSSQCAIDGKDRLWVQTFKEQPEIPEELSELQSITTGSCLKFEIFDGTGTLLTSFEAPDDLTLIRIIGDCALFSDEDLVGIHEYKIIEK